MSVKFIHFWARRVEASPRESDKGAVRISRCGIRVRENDFGKLTTARRVVTCQRCRNFLASDASIPPGPDRGRR